MNKLNIYINKQNILLIYYKLVVTGEYFFYILKQCILPQPQFGQKQGKKNLLFQEDERPVFQRALAHVLGPPRTN